MNRYITLNKNKIIISIRWGSEILEGEIESDVGEIGQKLNEDGSFKDIPKEDIPKNEETKTLEQQIEELKKDNVVLMNSIASLYEEIAKLGGTV